MARFAVRRLVHMAFVLFAISAVTFLIFYVFPGTNTNAQVQRIAGRSANDVTRAQVKKDYGFDRPFYVQYARLMENTADGSLISYTNQTNVRDEIVRGIPATVSLVLGAAVIWTFFGVLFGILSAVYAGRWPDRVLTVLSMIGISLPVFWVGALLLYYLTDRIELFPPGGYVKLTEDPSGWFTHLILPWVTLSILFIGFYSRLLRSTILDTIDEDFVRTARAKGVTENRVLVRHVLRNALIPIVTLFGLDFGAAIGGGAILTESIFSLQGVGQYAAQSVGSLDLPPVMGTTLYAAFFIVVLSALVDIAYAYLDPRIALES
ncbi:MAG TPA: ABC transporter permease [Solirubrobacteraceae bacterium]|jgi:peptide/nickel transport system permease protein|nr:ABC transporter permease [Solirubrobacteraceae bacterium]